MFDGRVVFVTGGTGSFGRKFVDHLFKNYRPRKVIIFSRDEFKQFEMSKKYAEPEYDIRYFLGDIRDKDRLYRSLEGVDYVIHAAALKQVPALEYNPFEAVKTNILGAQNIIDAAIDCGVKKVVALSTDKAVSPINLYGATKLAMEKLFIAANAYVAAGKETTFSIVRYGNVIGSRGSVIPFFRNFIENGKKVPITDERMTRFWITLDQGVELVTWAVRESVGGEVFIPKLPSMKLMDLIRAICPSCGHEVVGIRPGEKIHESLISSDDGRYTVDAGHVYAILPVINGELKKYNKYTKYPRMDDGFFYRSDTNDTWLTVEEISKMIAELDGE